MSWSERLSRRAALAALAGPLAACGFTPLYAPGAPAARMAGRVEVGLIEGAARLPPARAADRPARRAGGADPSPRRHARAREHRRRADPAEHHHSLQRHRHRRVRARAPRRRPAGRRRRRPLDHRLQRAANRRPPRPTRAAPPRSTPSGGSPTTSPSASCSAWRSAPRTGREARLPRRRPLPRPPRPRARRRAPLRRRPDAGGLEARRASSRRWSAPTARPRCG